MNTTVSISVRTMEVRRFIVKFLCIVTITAKNIKIENGDINNVKEVKNPDDTFNGVYTDCFVHMSFSCVQRKTLIYLKQLNNLSEVSVFGDYVKFVRLNVSREEDHKEAQDHFSEKNSEELTHMIDKAVDTFFDNHVIKFSALGKETSIPIPSKVEEFVGRKKRKGGGMGDGGGGHDGDGFGKKKMMMMAMMCMKMKLMMMVPAMMGMMGMMSFKGMMFSMMSFMLSKMMLLMKILEKKGGAGAGGLGGGVDGGGWATGGGGGGAWMPAGGQDYGGGGGGYDANGQWQSRSILDFEEKTKTTDNQPIISYVASGVRHNNNMVKKGRIVTRGNEEIKVNKSGTAKSRRKRSIIDVIQNSYVYWINRLLGFNNNRRTSNHPKFKMVNGIKYVYYPFRQQKVKAPKEIQSNRIKTIDEGFKPIITAEDFNKGEIVEGAVESRMNRKKLNKMKETVNETIDDNPWE